MSNEINQEALLSLVVISDERGRLLLNRRNDATQELWGLIGGSALRGESEKNTAVREVEEELGIGIADSDVREIHRRVTDDSYGGQTTVVYFWLQVTSDQVFRPSEEVGLGETAFFMPEEMHGLTLMPHTSQLLEDMDVFTAIAT